MSIKINGNTFIDDSRNIIGVSNINVEGSIFLENTSSSPSSNTEVWVQGGFLCVGDVSTKINVSFGTRPDFVTWATSNTPAVGTIAYDGKVAYVYDGTGSNFLEGALDGWRPFGTVSPQHFVYNATPGTTDMRGSLFPLMNYIDSFDIEGPVEVDLLGEKIAIGSKTSIGSKSTGVLFKNGTFITTGAAGDYVSVDNDPLTGSPMIGPMINFQNQNWIGFNNVHVLCDHVSSGFRFQQCEHVSLGEGFYCHGFGSGGYGIKTDTTCLEFYGKRPKIEQWKWGEVGFDDQANRDGYGFLLETADLTLDTPTSNYTKYPFFKTGFGS